MAPTKQETKASTQFSEQVTSAYQDEKETIDIEAKKRIELAYKIQSILDDYGYDLVAKEKNGVASITFVKRS